tara:strand:- start:27586 stop:30288 length:2703 start_codon:yes stop_codon:yes gene_type:complete
MLSKLITSFVGSRNQRVVKSMQKAVKHINSLEPAMEALSDEQLQAKTDEFKQRLEKGEKLDALMPEAFAVVREAGKRVLNMRHFDVQLVGGMVLHSGKIAEMRTGEGKTLVATLAVYLNALTGEGVHLVTVNDYLATRDAAWMGKLYNFLGMSVGVIVAGQEADEKRAAYHCDITYGTNNEYGFDYLRDNMAFSLEEKVQRQLNFAVIDEVDSILIDEARTPLIISGAAEDSSALYIKMDAVVPKLTRQEKEDDTGGDYYVDEKTKQIYLTETGHENVEALLEEVGLLDGKSLYDVANIKLMHHVNAALRANICFQKDVDYIVQDGEVVIVDEHTGRTMPGRRWSDGLHQAIEAKERANIQHENVTLAAITFQNFFRLYNTLSGMTGTADTEAFEFQQIYGLEVVVMPTNKPMVRKDTADQIYLTMKEKFDAVIEDVKTEREKNRPVLVGTASIDVSEYLSSLLKKAKVPHNVLNAKFHEKEAHIIAEAGRPGAVTIATNMAGRGTDIVLGGSYEEELKALGNPTPEQVAALKQDWQQRHDAVLAAGGLHIIGSERHESRRIDNQLRGRAGRQGDPGSSRFYLSLEDNLMRIFASERMAGLMQKLGMKEGESIEHPWVSRAIENAQRKVEGHNFDIRKQLLEYDDVANDQRKVLYSQRAQLMQVDDISATIKNLRKDVMNKVVSEYVPPSSLEEQWDLVGLDQQLRAEFNLDLNLQHWIEENDSRHEEHLREHALDALVKSFDAKEAQVGADVMRSFEKSVMLQSLDHHWREHLAAMDQLRQGIHLRGYAQKNPKQEYKRESFNMFTYMTEGVKQDVINVLSKVQLLSEEDAKAMEAQRRKDAQMKMEFQHADPDAPAQPEGDAESAPQTMVRDQPKVGRNDPCPCGSGKKYKQCHGRVS